MQYDRLLGNAAGAIPVDIAGLKKVLGPSDTGRGSMMSPGAGSATERAVSLG